MIVFDEGALICDFAETYHVLDYRALPARRAALYACGLRANSRIVQAMTGNTAQTDELLLAIIADAARLIAWMLSKDGKANRARPASIAKRFFSAPAPTAASADDVEEFRAWRASMIKD